MFIWSVQWPLKLIYLENSSQRTANSFFVEWGMKHHIQLYSTLCNKTNCKIQIYTISDVVRFPDSRDEQYQRLLLTEVTKFKINASFLFTSIYLNNLELDEQKISISFI